MPSNSENGEKSRLIWWLVGIIQVVILSSCAWVGASIVQAKADIAVLQSSYAEMNKKLDTIEKKLDAIYFSSVSAGRRNGVAGEWPR